MKLDVKALALAFGILWGGAILVLDVISQVCPGYAQSFLAGIASVYPGYEPTTGVASAVIGAGYGLVDGAIAGLVLAWLYNLIAK